MSESHPVSEICPVCGTDQFKINGEICDAATSYHGYPKYFGYNHTTPNYTYHPLEPGTAFYEAVVSFYSNLGDTVTVSGYSLRTTGNEESGQRTAEYTCHATGEKGLVYLD